MAEGEPQASSRIFISYRREDSTGFVRALFEPLRARFGRGRVFKDTDNIPPGQDFVKVITRELESCKVLLAVIGNEWIHAQDSRTKQRRLDNPNDTLRIEVSAALRNQNMTVIPVLVDRATMPRPEDLPEELWDLTRRNAVEVSDTRWETDVERLIRALEVICGDQPLPDADETPGREGQAAVPAHTEHLPKAPRADESGATLIGRAVQRRQRQIAEHLKAASEAFDLQDYQTVLAESERAIWLDPECSDARDFASRAQAAIDERSIRERLEEAERALAKGDLAAASEAIDLALSRSPEHPEAQKLRQELLRVRLARDQKAEQKRLIVAELASAQASLDDGDFAVALSHVDEALALEPDSLDAAALRVKIVSARAEAGRAREVKRRAQQTIADAQAAWADGRQNTAIEMLTAFAPPHDLIARALEEFRAKRKQAEEANEQAAAARAAAAAEVRRTADAKLAEVAAALAARQYDAAQQLVDAARTLDPTHPGLAEGQRRITEAGAEAAALERTRQEQQAETLRRETERREAEARDAAERARRNASAKLELVSAAIAERRYDDARARIEEARQLDPRHPDLPVWPQRIDEAVEADRVAEEQRREREAQTARDEEARQAALEAAAERARREADAKLALVAAAIAAKHYEPARQLVEEARRLDESHPALSAWETRLDQAIAADQVAEIAKRERDDRLAREQEARQSAAKAAAERARRAADTKLTQLEAAIGGKRYDAARELLEEARLLDPDHPDLESWPARIDAAIEAERAVERERQARAAQAALEEAERQAAAKAAALRARKEADGKLSGVRAAIEAKQYGDAKQLVEAAREIDAAHPALGDWRRQIDDAIAAERAAEQARQKATERVAREEAERRESEKRRSADRARKEAAAKLALVETAFLEQQYASARQLLEDAERIDPEHPALAEWRKKIARAEAGPRPAWVKYAAAAALVGGAVTAGILLFEPKVPTTPVPGQTATVPVGPAPGSSVPPPTVPSAGATAADTAATSGAASDTSGSGRSNVVAQGGNTTAGDPIGSGRSNVAAQSRNTTAGERGEGSARGRSSGAATGEGRAGTVAGRGGAPDPNGGRAPMDPGTGRGSDRGSSSGSIPGGSSQGSSTTAATNNPPPATVETPRGNPTPPPLTVGAAPVPIRGAGNTTPALPTPEQVAAGERAKQRAEDEAAIRRLLAQYSDAYSALDENRLREIVPKFGGIPDRLLIRSVKVTFGDPQISIIYRERNSSGILASATLLVPVSYAYVRERDPKNVTTPGTVSWNLEKDSRGWKVVSRN